MTIYLYFKLELHYLIFVKELQQREWSTKQNLKETTITKDFRVLTFFITVKARFLLKSSETLLITLPRQIVIG